MDKIFSARFFRVIATKGTPSIVDTLQKVFDLPIKDRLTEVQSVKVRLERLGKPNTSHLVFGDFTRLQADNKPGMASEATAEQPLNLPKGHSLAHTAAFGLDTKRSIICVQNNRSGLTARNLCEYLGTFADTGSYHFMPLIRKSALKRLSKMSVRTLKLKIGSPDDLTELDDEGKTAAANLKHLQSTFGGKYVEITLSVGHHKAVLKQNPLVKFVKSLSKNAADGNGNIKTLKVEGFELEDDVKTNVSLDILEDLISYHDHLVLPEDDADKNYAGRRAFIQRAFSNNESDLAPYTAIS
jgi:hypothetical protein